MTAELSPWDRPLLERWGPMERWTLPAVLAERAAADGDAPFIQIEDEPYHSAAEVLADSTAVARQLRTLGVAAGDIVLTWADTSLRLIHAWFGINLAGAADAPLNVAYRGHVLAHAVNLSSARVLRADHRFLDRLAEVEADVPRLEVVVVLDTERGATLTSPFQRVRLVALDDLPLGSDDPLPTVTPRDVAALIYTSGTSGPAKAVVNTHAQTYANAYETIDALHLTANDTYFTFHPMFHMAAKYCAVFAALVSGARITIDRTFRPEQWLERIRTSGSTVSMAHGPMIEMIYNQPARPDDADNPLRALIAAPFPAAIAHDFERRFGCKGYETWGMTEVTCVTWQPHDGHRPDGSCGRPIDELFEVVIVDPDTDEPLPAGAVGEITVRPKLPWIISPGYFGMPDRTVEAWRNLRFHSADAGYFDDEGFLYFVDRKSDRIRRRAENISSYEIEAAAMRHPAVAECAAIGVPSGFSSDDDIKVVVVAAPNATVDPLELIEHLVVELPHYMVPRYVEVLDALPRSATNKIQKALLREAGVTDATWDRSSTGLSLRELSERATSR